MKRDAQGAILMLVGAAALRLSLSDAYLRYVKEGLRPFLLFSGVVLLGLGLAAVFGKAQVTPADAHTEGHTQMDGHSHEGGPRIAWLLLLPILAIFLVAPPALGAYAASRDTSGVPPPADMEFEPLAAGDPVPVLVADYAVRAVWDEGRSLQGRTVRLTGFAVERPEGGWYLARMSMACCAADARPAKIEVRGDAPAPAPDTWVELTGTFVPSEKVMSDDGVPVVRAETVTPIAPPREPYE